MALLVLFHPRALPRALRRLVGHDTPPSSLVDRLEVHMNKRPLTPPFRRPEPSQHRRSAEGVIAVRVLLGRS